MTGRLETCAICPVCQSVFRPFSNRTRLGPPCCSHKCKGVQYRRTSLETSTVVEVAALNRRFVSPLTPRELQIFRHGVKVGRDRQRRARQREVA